MNSVEKLLCQGFTPLMIRVHRPRIEEIKRLFEAAGEPCTVTAFLHFLMRTLRESRERLLVLDKRFEAFCARYAAATRRQRPQHLLDFARDLGANFRELRGDRQALERFLDDEALSDRYRRIRGDLEQEQIFLTGRLAIVGSLCHDGDLHKRVYALLLSFTAPQHEDRLRTSGLEAISLFLDKIGEKLFPESLSLLCIKLVDQKEADTWLRCAALALLIPYDATAVLNRVNCWLQRPEPGDAIFLRHRGLLILGGQRLPLVLLKRALKDTSPFVRQALCRVLVEVPLALSSRFLTLLITRDSAEEVRGAALCVLPDLAQRPGAEQLAWQILCDALRTHVSGFAARVAVSVGLTLAVNAKPAARCQLEEALCHLRRRDQSPEVCRAAGHALERLWCLSHPQHEQIRGQLSNLLSGVKPGASIRLPRDLVNRLDQASLGRILAVLAQDDFGLDLESGITGYRLRKTPVFGFRLWRWWYELLHPAPDKRQGFDHTRARQSRAAVRAPSALLGETSPTRVPGEPLLIGGEGDWRPYLPLPDDALASLDLTDKQGPVQFFTGEGLVTLSPPKSFWRRLFAAARLSFGFARFARLRNWCPGDAFSPDAYASALKELDFELRIEALPRRPELDPGVTRFFGAGPLLFSAHLNGFREYLATVYDNSLRDLALFATVALTAFLAKSAWLYHQIRFARRKIPLVIGGWGTRGKSGSERLKAALFNAMGVRFLSKTTGCEACFLFATHMGVQEELPLFRPMAKASIWEQGQLIRLAAKMGSQVMLWECMGLNPGLVRILQREWMRDDLATITNTHPDHEDLQGPSGLDVAQTISAFIPASSRLVTAEEQMLPVLRNQAARLGTEVENVGWLEAGLLARDLLARFPYSEHPHNIAMVQNVAQSLGLKPDYALKEMADRVVPDLGVLKSFSPAPVARRRLSFVNGMSANERLGCLSNWTRLGFDRINPETEPGTVITLVVNNRADRTARSRVFAELLVRDVACDHIVLIGSNLKGFRTCLNEAWQDYFVEMEAIEGSQLLAEQAKRLRVTHTEEGVRQRLRIMLESLIEEGQVEAALRDWARPELLSDHLGLLDLETRSQVMAFLQTELNDLNAYRTMRKRLSDTNDAAVSTDLALLIGSWFMRKTLQIENPGAGSERVIEGILAHTPFGMHNRIMGIQNIKGPGIELISAFQTWELFQQACLLLERVGPDRLGPALSQLADLGKPGILARETVARTLAQVRQRAGNTGYVTRLEQMEQNLFVHPKQSSIGSASGVIHWLCSGLEALLEAGDAVRRRKRANGIYADLAAERIGFKRAATELKVLERRQQGGWLWQRLLRGSRRGTKSL